MKVEYSTRALADLYEIAENTRETFGQETTEALESRIRTAVAQIAAAPMSAPKVEQRSGIRVLSLVRYPYRIFLSRFPRRGQNSAHPTHVPQALGSALR